MTSYWDTTCDMAGEPIDYGLLIRIRREELGLSLRDLARRVPMAFQTLAKIETGRIKSNPYMIMRILKELNLEIKIVEVQT